MNTQAIQSQPMSYISGSVERRQRIKQESLANAKVSARQQCVYEIP